MGGTEAHWGRHPLSPREGRWARFKEFMREMVHRPRSDTPTDDAQGGRADG